MLYAEHPSTEIMCLVFAVNGEEPILITEFDLEDVHSEKMGRLHSLASDESTIFLAHNAPFEQAVWKYIMVRVWGFAPIPIRRWACTMAKAFAHGLPGSLEAALKALPIAYEKDMEGRRIMLKLSKPKKDGSFWTYDQTPGEFEYLYKYCRGDVVGERALDNYLRDLSPIEQRMWEIDQRMNQEGIYVDLPLIDKAKELADEHKRRLKSECKQLTDGIAPTQRKLLLGWLRRQGVELKNTKKHTLNQLLDVGGLPANAETAINYILEANKTSIAKYAKMRLMSTPEGLTRDQLQYHAAHTGRWGGRGWQPQNMTRPWENISVCSASIIDLNYDCFELVYDDVAGALSSNTRGALIAPPGKRMFVADLSQMESRVIAWLAGQQNVLDLYAAGEDLYCLAASDIFGYKVTKDMKMERQAGKVAVLALGFGGGITAFVKMSEAYDIDLRVVFPLLFSSSTLQEREAFDYSWLLYNKREKEPVEKKIGFVADIIKQRWRIANGCIEDYWHDLESTVIRAVASDSGEAFRDSMGKTLWFKHKGFLCCKLPSGRVMMYPYPKLHEGRNGKITISYFSARYGRTTTYGGKLSENVTQAVQRDLLRDVIMRLEDRYPVAFHIHDEFIAYVDMFEGSLDEYVEIAKEVPNWAKGIPIDCKGWEGTRYGKE